VIRFLVAFTGRWEIPMTITLATPLVALIAGILILIVPRLLNYVVVIYLIFIGLTDSFSDLAARRVW
jgi:hypothetical protein